MSTALAAAPEFPPALQWANAEPQTLGAHRGRVLAVLFWNASSPYCHNLIDDPDATGLRHELASRLVERISGIEGTRPTIT